MRLKVGSLFTGIGGFDLGFEQSGFEAVFMCEVDRAAQGVLRYRFPEARLMGDIKNVKGADVPTLDVLAFGSPCQDLSVAGKRAGLSGDRSGLFHEAIRIIRELKSEGRQPRFVVWENVVGALTSNNGDDFNAVLKAFLDIGATDIAWRVLDSQAFGVPQRRRRVFVVVDLAEECAESILLEQQVLSGIHSQGSKKAKPSSAFKRSDACSSGVECIEHGVDWDECGCWCADDERCPWCGEWTSGLHRTPESDGLSCCKAWFRRVCNTISDGAHMGGGLNGQDANSGRIIVTNDGRPRRLSVVECERLQGFPDDWTAHSLTPDGLVKDQGDGHRFRQLGNAVTVNVAAWIAKRLMGVMKHGIA